MRENFLPENQINSREEIAGLDEQIEELKQIQQAETAKFSFDDKSKKKKKKTEAATMELPQAREIRTLEYKSDDRGKLYFIYKDKDGYPHDLTKGDILTDMEWGVFYDLNHDVNGQEQRVKYEKFRRQYIEQFYQRQIDRLEAMKLALSLSEEVDDTYKSQTYREIYERLKDETKEPNEQAGFLFEKMLAGLVHKIAEDLGKRDDYKFSVQNASVFDDVELKADLILKLPEKNRGVGVEEKKKVEGKKGIQITLIGKDNQKWQHKLDQVAKAKEKIQALKSKGQAVDIDDLVMFEVEIGNKAVTEIFDIWKINKTCGGPELLFSQEMIMEFMAEIFKGSELDLDSNQKFKADLWEYFKNKKG